MLANQIKSYLIKKKSVSIAELAQVFTMDYNNMRTILHIWIREGNLRPSPPINLCCSTGKVCGNCTLTHLEFYDWVDFT